MDDESTRSGVSGPGEGPGGSLRPSVSSAGERIQVIIEAAEKAAAGIIEDAEVQAQRYLDESRRRVDQAAEQRSRALSELTDSLIQQAEAVKRQSADLIAALDSAKDQISEHMRTDLPQASVTQPEPVPADEVAASEPSEAAQAPANVRPLQPVAPAPEEPAAPTAVPEPADDPVPPSDDVSEQAPAQAPSPPAGQLSDGARLLATQMAVAGSSREQIAARLQSEFGIGDVSPILDSILGPEA